MTDLKRFNLPSIFSQDELNPLYIETGG